MARSSEDCCWDKLRLKSWEGERLLSQSSFGEGRRQAARHSDARLATSVYSGLSTRLTCILCIYRWGQSALLLSPVDDPTLLVVSGKAYVAGQTITSTPTSSSTLALSLNSSISDLSAPPWIESSVGPTAVYGSALALSMTSALFFGGDATGDPLVPVQGQNDSSWLLSYPAATTAAWSKQPAAWASQPVRRQSHYSVSATNGTLSRAWIFGGVRADGSGIGPADTWELQIDIAAEQQLSNGRWGQWSGAQTAPPTMFDGQAVLMPSSSGGQPTIYLIGGVQSVDSAQSLVDMSSVWAFTPGEEIGSGSWKEVELRGGSGVPAGRRGHVAVAVDDEKIWVQGGRSLDGATVLSDSAMLDVRRRTWTRTSDGEAVWGRSAVSIGETVLLAFGKVHGFSLGAPMLKLELSGYGVNAPGTSALAVYAPGNDTYLNNYSPSYITVIPNPKNDPAGEDSLAAPTQPGSAPTGLTPASDTPGTTIEPAPATTPASRTPDGPNASSPLNTSPSKPAPWIAPGAPAQNGDTASSPSSSDDEPGGTGSEGHAGNSQKTVVTGAVVGSLLGAVALVLVAGVVVLRRRRRNHRNRRPYTADRRHGRRGWKGEYGSALISNGGANADDEHGEQPLPVPTAMRSVVGPGGLRSTVVGLWKQAGGTPRAKEGRFAMLEDEESERWDSTNGRKEPASWTTFFNDDDEKDDIVPVASMSGRGGRGVWDSFDFGASNGSVDNIVSDTMRSSTSFLGSALGGFAAVPQRDEDNDDGDRSGPAAALLTLTPINEDGDEDAGSSSNEHTTTESGGTRSYQTHATSISSATTTTGYFSKSQIVPTRTFSPGVTSLYGSTFDSPLGTPSGDALRRSVVNRSSSNGSHGLQRSNSSWWALLSRRPTYADQPTRTASNRIRDPAPAPDLTRISESAPISAGRNPFDESNATGSTLADEQGQLKGGHGGLRHNRSLSSTASSSAATATSSVLEERMRHMDVVQRVRTATDGTSSSTETTPTMDSLDGPFGRMASSEEDSDQEHSKQDGGQDENVIFISNSASTPSEHHRNPFEDPPLISPSKRVRGPRPPPPALSSPTKRGGFSSPRAAGVRAMVEQFEQRGTPATGLPASASMSSIADARERPAARERRGSLGGSELGPETRRSKIGHGLARKPVLYLANPDQ